MGVSRSPVVNVVELTIWGMVQAGMAATSRKSLPGSPAVATKPSHKLSGTLNCVRRSGTEWTLPRKEDHELKGGSRTTKTWKLRLVLSSLNSRGTLSGQPALPPNKCRVTLVSLSAYGTSKTTGSSFVQPTIPPSSKKTFSIFFWLVVKLAFLRPLNCSSTFAFNLPSSSSLAQPQVFF